MLKLHVEDLRNALETPRKDRGWPWAHDRCSETRLIHEAVWEERPETEYVRDDVLPLLVQAEKALRALASNDPDSERGEAIAHFADNTEYRILNMRWNYLRGKPSGFSPDSRLWNRIPERLREAFLSHGTSK